MNFLNEDPIIGSPTHMFSLDRRHLFQQSVLNLGRIKTCTKHPGSTFPPVLEMSHNWKVNSCWAHKSERTSLNRWKVTHKHVQKETAWGNTAMALMKRPAIEQYAIICHRWFCFIYFEKQPLRESDSWALCWLCICFMTRFWFTKGCWGFGSFNFACHPQSVKDRASIHVLSQDYGVIESMPYDCLQYDQNETWHVCRFLSFFLGFCDPPIGQPPFSVWGGTGPGHPICMEKAREDQAADYLKVRIKQPTSPQLISLHHSHIPVAGTTGVVGKVSFVQVTGSDSLKKKQLHCESFVVIYKCC